MTSAHTDRQRDAFLRAVIEGRVRAPEVAAGRASALGVDLTRPIGLVLLVDASAGDEPTHAPFEERVVRVAEAGWETSTTVFLEPNPNLPATAVALAPMFESSASVKCDRMASACDADGLVAVWAAAPGVGRVPVLWPRLRRLVPVVERAARWLGPVMALEAVFPYWLAASLPEHEVDETLVAEAGPLMRQAEHAARRVDTWKLLVRERPTLAEAAPRLDVGESTVGKRRTAIEALTARGRGEETFRAHVASYLLELLDGDLDPPGDPWWEGRDGSR